MTDSEWDEWDFYDDEDSEWDDWQNFDCGLTDTGFCYDAGTENCSFRCPFSNLINHESSPPLTEDELPF